jgi:hypothetical protein
MIYQREHFQLILLLHFLCQHFLMSAFYAPQILFRFLNFFNSKSFFNFPFSFFFYRFRFLQLPIAMAKAFLSAMTVQKFRRTFWTKQNCFLMRSTTVAIRYKIIKWSCDIRFRRAI